MGRRGAVPYRKTDILVIKVWFAVAVDNGQSRTPVPTNKVFVSPIEVTFFSLASVRKRAR